MSQGARSGVMLLVVTSVLWGTTGTAASFAQGVSPLAIGAVSLGVGGLLQGAIALGAIRAARQALRAHRRTVIVGALGVAVYPLAFYSSMDLGGVALGTVISLGSAPIASGVLERVVDGVRLTSRWWCAAVLGIAGCALLGSAEAAQSGQAGGISVASSVALGLLAGASYAAYSWSAGRLMSAGLPRRAAMGSVFAAGGLLLLPVLLALGAPLLATTQNVLVATYLALIPMFVGYVLFGVALSRVPASTATTVTLLEPAVAAMLAVLVVGEHVTIPGWVGMALIAAGLLVLVAVPHRAAPPPRPARSSGPHVV
ncbi:EamA family transporter [Zhihengliuella alba]|uniref:EamA family transporter n=1 Tax=Zhihengliuella alba TaxID=547018 RepID=A0ABP7DTY4_9MICC